MKKFALLITLFCGIAWTATAQQKKPVTVKIATPTVQCEQCKKRIEDYMKHEQGITKVNVNFKEKDEMAK